jgi:hypothetical protein
MPNWNQDQPAPTEMLKMLKNAFPAYIKKDVGVIFAKRDVAGTATPSDHSEGRALDIQFSILPQLPTEDEKQVADFLFRVFIEEYKDLGMHHVIWKRQKWSVVNPTVATYPDPAAPQEVRRKQSPHLDHIHVSWTREGSQFIYFPKVSLRVNLYAHLRKQSSSELEKLLQ